MNDVSRFIKGEAVEPIPLINNMRGEKRCPKTRKLYMEIKMYFLIAIFVKIKKIKKAPGMKPSAFSFKTYYQNWYLLHP